MHGRARKRRTASSGSASTREKEEWLLSLRQLEWDAARESDRSGMYGVLHVRGEDIDSPVKIGLHTSVPAGRILHRSEEPETGTWLEKTVRTFVPPWTVSPRGPSIYPD